jgi:NAD(P)-dependent dehydrogenase (short-subunit alcohol dehydrogenase family)
MSKDGSILENKVALVTGAAGAIGYGICEVFLENGCTVVATDLPGERLDNFAKDLNELAPGKSIGIPMDVTSVDSTAKAIDRVFEVYNRLDIVVHNAGIAHVSKIVDMDLAKFQLLEKVNVDGTLIVLAEAGRRLIKQGKGGDIVIMSTKNVPSPSAGFSAYSATKAACHQLGRIASLEFAEYDIRVNMVAPDAVFSEGKYKSGLWELVGNERMKVRGISEKELHDYYRNRNLLKAAVTGRHVANAVLYFVSRQSPTTGATIPVDGGLPDATPR